MGKSLKNSVTPDEMYETYGADTLRLHEMFMGPLDQDRPWFTETVVGSHRLIQRVWRNLVDEETGELAVTDEAAPEELLRLLHRTIAGVRDDMAGLRFNTAIAKITELNNELTRLDGPTPREIADQLVLLLAPLVPHVAEELWSRLGHTTTVTYETFPVARTELLGTDTVELPVQVNGKVRSRISVAVDASDADVEAAALADERIGAVIGGSEVRKVVVVPGRLVNLVVA
jgi:leucyl-tRNA synthetase